MDCFHRQALQAFLALGALLVGIARAANAQNSTITGTVVDQAGGPVSPAREIGRASCRERVLTDV